MPAKDESIWLTPELLALYVWMYVGAPRADV